MNLNVIEIKNKNNIQKERIVLKALANINIGNYIIFLTNKVDNENFEANPNHVFWFPNKEVTKGDLVVLYTKEGKASVKDINEGNNKAYFFYKKLNKEYFTNDEKVAIVIEVSGWEGK